MSYVINMRYVYNMNKVLSFRFRKRFYRIERKRIERQKSKS